MFMTKRLLLLGAGLTGFLCWADEGMWPVNQFPKQAVQKRYGFEPTGGFLGHIQRSSVRFNSGGSVPPVSPERLLFAPPPPGRGGAQKVSPPRPRQLTNAVHP